MTEETKKPSNILYIIFLALGLGGAACIFGVFFENFSEEDMMNYSYLLAFFNFAGIAGLSTKTPERKLKNSLIWGFTALLLMVFFMVSIFPSL